MWDMFLETALDFPTQAAEDLVQFLTSDIDNDLSDTCTMFKIIGLNKDCQHKQVPQFSPKVKIWWHQV